MARPSLTEKYERSKLANQQPVQWSDKKYSQSPDFGRRCRNNDESRYTGSLPQGKSTEISEFKGNRASNFQRPILPSWLSENNDASQFPPRTYNYVHNDITDRSDLKALNHHNEQESNKPSLNDINSTVTRVYESPIKSIRFTPSKLRPARIYKVLNHQTSSGATPRVTPLRTKSGGILVNRDKISKYSPKTRSKLRPSSRQTPQKSGMFHKLRSFLSSLTNSEEDSDFDRLSKSAKDLLNFRSDPLPMREQHLNDHNQNGDKAKVSQKRVNFGEQLETPVKRSAPFMNSTPIKKISKQNDNDDTLEDIVPVMDEPLHPVDSEFKRTAHEDDDIDNDMVDRTLRINSELRRKQELTDRLHSLMKALDEEKERSRNMESEFEIELTNIKFEYNQHIQQLKNEIRSLKANAGREKIELEESRIEEIRSSFWKEHESFFIKQKQREQRLDSLQQSIEDQQRKLDAEWHKLAESKSLTHHELDSNKLDMSDVQGEGLDDYIGRDFPRVNFDSRKFFEDAMTKLRLEQADLESQTSSIIFKMESYEEMLLNLLTSPKRTLRHIFDEDVGITEQEVHMAEPIDFMKGIDKRKTPDHLLVHKDLEAVDKRIMTYIEKLQNTRNALNRLDYESVYNTFDPDGVELSFSNVKTKLEKRFNKRQNHLAHLDIEISQFSSQLGPGRSFAKMHSFDSFSHKRMISALNAALTLSSESKHMNSLLLKINAFMQDLEEVKFRLEHGADFYSSIQADDFISFD